MFSALNERQAFITGNMPLDNDGSLSNQQAIDITAYPSHLARPEFAGKADGWPGGRAPKGVRRKARHY